LKVDDVSISERIADWVQAQSKLEIERERTRSQVSGHDSDESAYRYGSIGAVVGATYPEQLACLRERMPNAWLLIPGYGAQGGNANDLACAFDASGLGAIVNNSRGIIFAHQSNRYQHLPDWQSAVEASTLDMIEAFR
jgi:orotidine-5'-phosphate decarboxylase